MPFGNRSVTRDKDPHLPVSRTEEMLLIEELFSARLPMPWCTLC